MEISKEKIDLMIGRIFFNKYRIIKNIGEGSFGQIYSAKYNNKWFALKFENRLKNQNLLENEGHIMSYLQSKFLPSIYSFGFSGEYNVLVMELMGKSLENIFENSNPKKFSVNCVAKLGLKMVEILEYIHNMHIIHRDIKPDNFVLGRGEKCKNLYILDFGLAKKYRSSRTLKHYPMIKKKNLTGTARYASINALNGLTQSRRDDLEAVGYVLLYFLRGKLPWQGIHVKKKEDRYHRIMEIKMETSPKDLCEGFPQEFESYVKYCRGLEYKEDPDYNYLKKLFNNVLKDYSENTFDWDKTIITATTSSTSKKCTNMEKNNEKQKIKNIYSEKFMSAFNNRNYSTINSKEVITNTYINKKNTQIHTNIINTSNDYEDLAEFTEEENIKKKLPNAFSKIHNKQQLEKSFELSMKKDNNFCVII